MFIGAFRLILVAAFFLMAVHTNVSATNFAGADTHISSNNSTDVLDSGNSCPFEATSHESSQLHCHCLFHSFINSSPVSFSAEDGSLILSRYDESLIASPYIEGLNRPPIFA